MISNYKSFLVTLALAAQSFGCSAPLKSSPSEFPDLQLRNAIAVGEESIRTGTLKERMFHYRVPDLSLAIVDNGEIVYRSAWGPETTPSTLFQAASISKMITAIGALELVREKAISLDAPVADILPISGLLNRADPRVAQITLRQLLSHSAGLNLPGFSGSVCSTAVPSLPQLLKQMDLSIAWNPGSSWHYSGGGTSIVQLLIEKVTQTPYSVWMNTRILGPLGMSKSRFDSHLDPSLPPREAARGHAPFDEPIAGGWKCYPQLAAAGLWSTPTDLARVMVAIQRLYQGESGLVLDGEIVRQMLTVQKAPSGLGPFLSNENGALVFEHEGVNEGYVSRWHGFILRHPDGTLRSGGAVVMTNSQNGEFLIDEVFRAISDRYQWPHWRPLKKTLYSKKENLKAERLQSWAGLYKKDGESNFFRILVQGQSLSLQMKPDGPAESLFPESSDRFFSRTGVLVHFDKPHALELGSSRNTAVTRWKKAR